MSGRRAKALRRGSLAAVNHQTGECIPEYLGYWSWEGLTRRGRWATIPGSWRRMLRKRSAHHQTATISWQRGTGPEQTRRVVTGSTPPGQAAQAERVTVRKPRSVGFTSMVALMLAGASSSGEETEP